MKRWSIENRVISDAQFGFKQNHSTVDSIFVLNSLIERQLRNNGRLFTCCVDFCKAYDYVDRNALWYKLIQSGIDGKLLSVIRSMYKEVKLAVRHLNTVSEFYDSEIGLFQGEITIIFFSLLE